MEDLVTGGALLIGLGIMIVPAILFLVTLTQAMSVVSPGNRKFAPGLVWLTLIPYAGQIWMIFVAKLLAESLQNEGRERRIDVGDGAMVNGLVYACLMVVSTLLSYIAPSIVIGFVIINLFSFIGYWVQIAKIKKLLLATYTQMQ